MYLWFYSSVTFKFAGAMKTKSKTVLMLYSDDFGEHEKAVECFARFLGRCQCKMVFELWDQEIQQDRRRWIAKHLDDVDKVSQPFLLLKISI